MTVREITEQCAFKALSLPNPEREAHGAYIGDLLSWVMGRAKANCVWITIMSNINIVAVASLADTAAVILAEGVEPDESVVAAAEAKGVNLLVSTLPAYETAKLISSLV